MSSHYRRSAPLILMSTILSVILYTIKIEWKLKSKPSDHDLVQSETKSYPQNEHENECGRQ